MANIEEYKMHREEIMYLMKKRDSFLTYAYTVMAAIWSIAFTKNSGWLVFWGMSLLVVFALKNLDLAKSLMRLSAYLSECLEPHLDIKWETLNEKYHEEAKKDNKAKARRTFLLGRLDFIILQGVNIFIFWFFEFELIFQNITLAIVVMIVQGAFFVIQALVALKDSKNSTYKSAAVSNWKKVLVKEVGDNSNVQKD